MFNKKRTFFFRRNNNNFRIFKIKLKTKNLNSGKNDLHLQ